jgi:hypothetical protein
VIRDLDKGEPCISSSSWRSLCLGVKENGDPAGSNATWTKFRNNVGVFGNRKLTQHQAVCLFIRSRMKEACFDLDIPVLPSDSDIYALEALGEEWFAKHGDGTVIGMVKRLTRLDNLTGVQVEEVLKVSVGKSLSPSTIYRKCNQPGVPKFHRRKRYTANQVKLMIKAVSAP